MDPATTDKLTADLRAVMRDAEALLQAAAAEVGEPIRETAGELDQKVRANPWAAIGIAAGAGLLLGLLLGRK